MVREQRVVNNVKSSCRRMGHYRPVIRMNIVEEPRIISQHLHHCQLDTTTSRLTIPNSTITWQQSSYIIHHASSSIVVACSCVSSLACTSTPLATISLLSNSNNSPLDDQTGWFMTVKILMVVKNDSEKCLKPRAIFWQPSNAWNSWRAGSNIWKWVCTRGMYLRVIYRNIKKADFY